MYMCCRYYSKHVHVCDPCTRKRENYMGKQSGGEARTALNDHVGEIDFPPDANNIYDPLVFLADNRDGVQHYLADNVAKHKGIKWSLTLDVQFMRVADDSSDVVTSRPPLNSGAIRKLLYNIRRYLCKLKNLCG